MVRHSSVCVSRCVCPRARAMEWRGHSDMLHDIERNRLYREAIVRRVAELSAGNEQARVIDIGTGSGLLACVASASGASVVAFECVSKLAKLAKRVVDDNGLEIDIKCAHSTAATSRCSGWAVGDDLVTRPRASLMTHELLDSGLLSEGLLQATRHACDVLLDPSALTVPHSIRLYAQPVRCGFFRSAATLRTAAHLLPLPPAALQCEGAAGYLELDVQPLLRSQRAIPLAEPVCVLDLDLSSRPPAARAAAAPTASVGHRLFGGHVESVRCSKRKGHASGTRLGVRQCGAGRTDHLVGMHPASRGGPSLDVPMEAAHRRSRARALAPCCLPRQPTRCSYERWRC